MKTLLSLLFLLFVSLATMAQKATYSDLPVTTKSPQAHKLYDQGIQDMVNIKNNEAIANFTKAADMDPDFMMANYRLAMNELGNNNMDQFKTFANKALNSKAKLNETEKVMQQVLKTLVDDPKADVRKYAEKVVEMNPKSFMAHMMLANNQGFHEDYEGALKTFQTMLTLTDKPAPVYNSLGYTYMSLNQMDKAKDYFEKYMKADPNNANAYDSMGDYYAKVENFKEAQNDYMKAYNMDSANFKMSQEKAMKVKEQMVNK